MSKHRRSVACIVDCHGPALSFARLLKHQGWRVLHLRCATTPEQPTPACTDTFCDTIWQLPQLPYCSLVEHLRLRNTHFVIAGAPGGVGLADQLAASLRLPGNPPRSSQRRGDRLAMAQALARLGLDTPRQKRVDSEAALLDGLQTLASPVVVKPVEPSGERRARVCHAPEQALAAWLAIANRHHGPAPVLLQEFIQGPQFLIKVVSLHGRHRVTEIWHEQWRCSPGRAPELDHRTLVHGHGALQKTLIDYLCKALDALEVLEGPSQSRLALTRRGPLLLDTRTCLDQPSPMSLVIEALGCHHLAVMLERYLDPRGFATSACAGYALTRILRIVNLGTSQAGSKQAQDDDARRLLASLPSFRLLLPAGGNAPGPATWQVCLLHDSFAQVEQDYRQIRAWEDAGQLPGLVPGE